MKPLFPALRRVASDAEIHASRYLIALTVTLASVMELVDTSIVNVAIPHMMGTLGATLDEIAWVSTGYVVANVIVLPISGWLANWFGRRNYLALSIMLFIVASMLCGAATSLEGLVFWRIVQGLGGGGLIATAQATLYEVFPRREAGTAMAIFGLGIMVGPMLGPTLGGWLTDAYSWPWIFYINLPLGILALLLTLTLVPDSKYGKPAERIDTFGFLLLAVGIGCLQTVLERGEKLDWFASREIVGLSLLSFFALVAFVQQELRHEHPVVEIRSVNDMQFAAAVFGYSMWQHSLFTVQSGWDEFLPAMIFRGIGLGMMFIPLNNLALGNLPPQQVSNGSGIYNLTRQLGGSVGIAASATLFAQFQQANRGELLRHVSQFSAATTERLTHLKALVVAHGTPSAQAQAKELRLLDAMVAKQAAMLAFERLFLLFGAALLLALPLLLLMPRGRFTRGGDTAAH